MFMVIELRDTILDLRSALPHSLIDLAEWLVPYDVPKSCFHTVLDWHLVPRVSYAIPNHLPWDSRFNTFSRKAVPGDQKPAVVVI